MKDNIWLALGILIGVTAVFVTTLIWSFRTRQKQAAAGLDEFDERQQLVRGKAYHAAYLTLMGYLCTAGCADLMGFVWSDRFTFGFLGVCLSGTVFAVCCIRGGAFVSFQKNPHAWLGSFAGITLINLIFGGEEFLERGSAVSNGRLTFRSANLIAGLMCAIILAAVLMKRRADAQAEKAEEDS